MPMLDTPQVANPVLSENHGTVAEPEASGNIPGSAIQVPTIRFPPFPPPPEGAEIIPFSHFKESGIQIFSPNEEEIDGRGIPTVPLRVPHDTDKRKTQAKVKPVDDEGTGESNVKYKGKGLRLPMEKMDPVARAQEQRRQRIALFAKKEWYEQWAEGEDLRGTKAYDTNLTAIDRIHLAATEFRTSRIWPPGHLRVNYLWDQFRLYAGLLGSPPVWTRTDLPQQESSDDFDDETDSETEYTVPTRTNKERKPKKDESDEVDQDIENATQARQKRIPPRTPYALYNLVPIPVSSDAEVRKLLSLSTGRRESKLLNFLADPERSVRVFLSWYLRHEGLIWSPIHIVAIPYLVSFFIEFLIRVKALPESERGLKKAAVVAKQGIVELGRTGKLCRELPDRFGSGLQALWGKRWEEGQWSIDLDYGKEEIEATTSGYEDSQSENDRETQDEALKRFEDELKAANMQFLPADPKDLGISNVELSTMQEEGEVIVNQTPIPTVNDAGAAIISINPAVQQSTNDDAEPAVHNTVSTDGAIHQNVPSLIGSSTTDELVQTSMPEVINDRVHNAIDLAEHTDAADSDVPSDKFDWSKPDGIANPTEVEERKNAWAPSMDQPLMEIFGMTTFPLKYDAGGRGNQNNCGVVERSMRKVKAVSKPGEIDKDRKFKGVEDDLIKRLARVLLTPWVDWDDGNIAIEYRTPRTQGATPIGIEDANEESPARDQEKYNARYAHDPQKDDITVLVEPHIADLIVVGMGMAGTWVQLVPLHDQSRTNNGRGRGRGRGGGARGSHAEGSGSKPQKEFTFWYVEELHLAVPSFWEVGEEEKPLTLTDLENSFETREDL